MVRALTYDERGMKKGAWSKEEDDKLRAYILKYGHWNWRQLPRFAGLSRCGKSCRLRWLNYLRPNLKRGGYTKEEEDLIIKLHEELGNKWSLISAKLPGRTDNEIKNHWHAYLKKRIMKEKYSSEIFSARSNDDGDQIEAAESENGNPGSDSFSNNPTPSSSLENFPLSTATSSNDEFCSLDSELDYNLVGTEDSRTVTTTSWEKFEECTGDFWTEPFLTDEDYNQDCGFSSLSKDELELAYYSYFHGNDLDLLYQVM